MFTMIWYTLRYSLDSWSYIRIYVYVTTNYSWYCSLGLATLQTRADLCIPRKKQHVLVPNFHIHVSVSDFYIPTISPHILLQKIAGLIMGIYKSLTDT